MGSKKPYNEVIYTQNPIKRYLTAKKQTKKAKVVGRGSIALIQEYIFNTKSNVS